MPTIRDLGYSVFNRRDNADINEEIVELNQVIPGSGVGFGELNIGVFEDNQDIQSRGFVSGSTGWRIQGDGTAEFQNVIVTGVALSDCTGDLDDIDNGTTYSRVLTTDITAGHILLSAASGDSDDIGEGSSNFFAGASGADFIKAIDTLDNVSNGATYGRVAITDITAGHIVLAQCDTTGYTLDSVSDGATYGRIAITDISSGHILLSTCTGDLDNIDDGTTYSRIATTDITAGHITLVSSSASININDTTFGNQGIQLQYNAGTPRGYIGDGSNAFFNFDGTKLTWKAANTELDGDGKLTLAGATIGTSVITGIATGSEIAIQGWQSDLVFSATDYRIVAWASGTITLMNGDTYSIDAGNTGNMAALTYIYLDIATSITVLQTTTTPATAVGTGKILIAVAENNADTTSDATFQVFGGSGGNNLLVDNIVANSASTNEFISNTAQIKDAIITNAKIDTLAVSKLTAGTITSQAITLAITPTGGDTYIAAGKTDFGDTTAGFILGIDDSDSDIAKFEIGEETKYLKYDPTNGMRIAGNITISNPEDINTSDLTNGAGWTDDTTADTAITNAATAQTAADDAQGDATTALGELDDIAADDKITPVEKLTLLPIWNSILAEKTDIDSEADTFSVSKTDYGTAYDNLYGYVVTTLSTFDNMAATTDITRATWNGYFEAYYNAKVEILNAISTAAKGLADTAQGAADDAQGDATDALSELDDIADDAKITPVEKLTLKPLWDDIVVEGTATTGTIPTQATLFGVADTDFDTAYATLYAYIITTLDVFNDMEATTAITRATWDTDFEAYYNERTLLLNAIAAKARTLANTAQSAAEAAQGDATTALNSLTDISDDAKITPVEKLTVKPLWDSIVAEKTTIDTQADVYSVSKVAYGTAYDNLYGYVITTLDVFDDMSATTSITRATWDGYFEAYYGAKVDILNDIADATALLADWTGLSNIPGTLGTPAGAGLFLSATYLGYYDSSNWKTYMDSSGNFYLGGSSGKLQWDASEDTLTITGVINDSRLVYSSMFGDGAAGDVVSSGDITLTDDVYYDNLTISSGDVLYTDGYRVFVKDTLTFEGTGKIVSSGGDGGNGGNSSGDTAGTAGAAGTQAHTGGILPDSPIGEVGSAGVNNTDGIAGTAGDSFDKALLETTGAAGGAGGFGKYLSYTQNGGAAGAGGAIARKKLSLTTSSINFPFTFVDAGEGTIDELDISPGAGSGGSGGCEKYSGSPVGASGGSGGAGGCVWVFAQTIVTVDGNVYIEATGGDGGDAGTSNMTAPNGATGGSGGGGGGAGGIVLITYARKSGTGTIDITAGTGGTGSDGASNGASASDSDGADGANGQAGIILYL